MLKFLLIFFLFFSTIDAQSNNKLRKDYESLKIEYLKAILNDQKNKEVQHLEKLIFMGRQLKEDVSKYERELNKIKKTIPSVKKIATKPLLAKNQDKKINNKSNNKFNISSVIAKDNSIIINFTNKISKKDLKFIELKDKSGHKDIFDINGTFKDAYGTKLKLDLVDRIMILQYKPETLRITLRHAYNPKTIYVINDKQIIIKVLDNNTEVNNTITKDINKTVVIDPGHGGKDPGAIGANKTYEKNITLKTSKYLSEILKKRGYRVYLTRSTDKFLELRDRTKFSNDKKADIFISIHVNAVDKKRAKKTEGLETYFLSPARSDRAKNVAARENKGDMEAMNSNSQMTFLTVLNQSKITESNKLAIDIQQNMLYNARNFYKKTVDGGVREGPFWVLVGAQMPSVLVELGYVSHPKEKKRLVNDKYLKNLALGLANGVDAYFVKSTY